MTLKLTEPAARPDILAGRYLYSLMRTALVQDPLPALPQGVTWSMVLNAARRNALCGLTYYGFSSSENQPDPQLKAIWRKDLLFTVMRQTRMNEDRRRVLDAMEKTGLEYLCMKGCVIQDFYPKPGMREMSDNDILYRDPADRKRDMGGRSQKKMKQVMESLNAQTVSDDGVVDVFIMHETSLFEMHRSFFSHEYPLHAYFDNLLDRTQAASTDHPGHRVLDPGDHFLLMLAHSHKHFTNGGCGPREIADYFIFTQKYADELDWKYLERELKKTGLDRYAAMMKRLSGIVFGNEKATEQDWKLLDLFASSGTYGSPETWIDSQIEHASADGQIGPGARIRYICSRLFPSKEYLESHYPFFARHPALSPVLFVYRLYRAATVRRRQVRKELALIRNQKNRSQNGQDE